MTSEKFQPDINRLSSSSISQPAFVPNHINDSAPFLINNIRTIANLNTANSLHPEDYFVNTPQFFLQFRGLIYQRINIQKRRCCTYLCQIFVPLFLLLIIGFLQLLTDSLLNKSNFIIPSSDILPIPINLNFTIPCDLDILNNRPANCTNDFKFLKFIIDDPKTCKFLLNFLNDLNPFFSKKNNIDCSNPRRVYQILPQYYLFELPFYLFSSNSDLHGFYGSLSPNDTKFGFLGSFTENQYKFSLKFYINPKFDDPFYNDHVIFSNNSVNNIFLPFIIILNTSNPDVSIFHIYAHMLNYNSLIKKSQNSITRSFQKLKTSPSDQNHYFSTLNYVKRKYFKFSLPYSAFHIHKLNSTFLDILIISPEFQLSLINYESHRGNKLLNQICNSFFNFISNDSKTNHINTWIFPIPEQGNFIQLNIFDLVGDLLFPLLTSLSMPYYIDVLVQDREGSHLIMMKLSNLREHTYFIISSIYFFFHYTSTLFPALLASLAFEIRIFMHSSFILLIIIFSIWGCTQIIMALFFSIFFNRARVGTNISYVVIISGILISFVVNLSSIFSDSVFLNSLYMLYPPFAFYRVLHLLNSNCQKFQCFQLDVFFSWNTVVMSICFLSFGSLLFLLFSTYFLMIFPNKNYNRKHPLFCLFCLINIINIFRIKCFSERINNEIISRRSITKNFNSKESIMNIYRLRKAYKTGTITHIAVKGFTLQIFPNECFGLLGSNGAGKTTLISMLAGIVAPSSGEILIGGLSFNDKRYKIYAKMGYCPQNNILYSELTCSDHILFYSRLKGVKIQHEKAVLDSILKMSKLFDDRNVKVNFLSGGLRRRLSIALSIINNPNILILDEPTAGLDPISRNYLWAFIKRLKNDRAIIISTHNMEEAETLCTKVGILHFGVLRALGTQLILKTVYTEGYEIKILSNFDSITKIKNYLHLKLPCAKFIDISGDFLFYRIPFDKFNIVSVLTVFVHLSQLQLINDWEIKNRNLEEILFNVTHHVIDKRDKLDKSILSCSNFPSLSFCYNS